MSVDNLLNGVHRFFVKSVSFICPKLASQELANFLHFTTFPASKGGTSRYDEEPAREFGLFPNQVTVIIHYGYRGFGYQICSDGLAKFDTHTVKRRRRRTCVSAEAPATPVPKAARLV